MLPGTSTSGAPPLSLRAPRPEDEAAGRAAQVALTDDGFDFLLIDAGQSWTEWLADIARERTGTDLPAGRVPATFLLAVVGDQLVGRVSIRHELNDVLLEVGGHIGYAVLPQFRRRGYAAQILGLALAHLRDLGVDRALVTCDDDNAGSARTVEGAGGVLEDIRPHGRGAVGKRRYWIALPAS